MQIIKILFQFFLLNGWILVGSSILSIKSRENDTVSLTSSVNEDAIGVIEYRVIPKRKVAMEVLARPSTIDSEKKKTMHSLLLTDYNGLLNHSDKIRDFGISEKVFDSLFWEGLVAALGFYKSNENLQEESIRELIETDLRMDPNLVYPVDSLTVIRSSIKHAMEVLERFSGQWYGFWKEMKVHHLWMPVRKHKKRVSDENTLLAFQSCFVEDGIGWNYMVRQKNKILVLGFVYHFTQKGEINTKNPHYAHLNSPNSITWVTDDHIYFESICDKDNIINEEYYKITGGSYINNLTGSTFVSKFQTIYLRNDVGLQKFIDLTGTCSPDKNEQIDRSDRPDSLNK